MEDLSSAEKTCLIIKTAGAFMFCVSGFTGFFLGVLNGNWNSAMFSVLLEITCVAVITFGRKYIKKELQGKFSARFFRIAKFVVVAFALANLAACIVFIVIGVKGEETYGVRSHYVAALVAGLTTFWSVVLFFDFHKYESLME